MSTATTAVQTPAPCPECNGTGDYAPFAVHSIPCTVCGGSGEADGTLTPMDGVLADLGAAVDSALVDAMYAMRQLRHDDTSRAMDAVERIIETLSAVRA